MPESAKAHAAFQEYCALGPGRSLAKLAERGRIEGKPWARLPSLEQWSSQHGWQERVKLYDQERIDENRRKRDAEIEAMNQRHSIIGTSQQARAIKQIEALIEASAFGSVASVQLLKLATDLERLARGAPTERTEQTGPEGGPIQAIFYLPKVEGEEGYNG